MNDACSLRLIQMLAKSLKIAAENLQALVDLLDLPQELPDQLGCFPYGGDRNLGLLVRMIGGCNPRKNVFPLSGTGPPLSEALE